MSTTSSPSVASVYLIRNTATGLWYTGMDDTYGPHPRHGHLVHTAASPAFSEKYGKAKKFKRLADVRAHMLIHTGYYENLPDTETLPEWMACSIPIQWPSSIEIVELDKVSKTELRTLETHEHLTRAWRLRDLTVKFGSAVRAMYKKLEAKDLLGSYPAMVVFRDPELENTWDYEMDADGAANVATLAKSMGKDKVLIIKHKTNVCLACVNEAVAWLATSLYSGALQSHVVSLTTLLEAVPTNTNVERSHELQDTPTIPLPALD